MRQNSVNPKIFTIQLFTEKVCRFKSQISEGTDYTTCSRDQTSFISLVLPGYIVEIQTGFPMSKSYKNKSLLFQNWRI